REKHVDVASFRAGRSPKEVIEFFNYPKSTVYDQWKAWTMLIAKERSRSWGHQSRRVCRRVEEEGQRGRQQVLRQVGCRLLADHRQHHQQGPGLQFVQEEAPAHKSRETGVAVGELPTTGAWTCGPQLT
ncbi:Hypothetical protein FKW44_006070, partial [Caligus rogercresseyi]